VGDTQRKTKSDREGHSERIYREGEKDDEKVRERGKEMT
jgi:hypothetical protein